VSPHSLVRALEDACAVFGGQRRCCIARELTKVHEELHRNTLAGALAEFTERAPRGEVTLVVEGATEEAPSNGEGVTDEVLLDVLLEAAGSGLSPSQAAKSAAAALGIPRQRAYALLAANPARLKGGEV
jgi:16S rRNA (cytidine1402-2'-O)-methyltransferase